MADVKPSTPTGDGASGAADEHIQIKVDGNELLFKIKRGTPLQKLMKAYCTRQGIRQELVRFLYDGERLRPEQTPQELDMDNDDIIDAMVEQIGGIYT